MKKSLTVAVGLFDLRLCCFLLRPSTKKFGDEDDEKGDDDAYADGAFVPCGPCLADLPDMVIVAQGIECETCVDGEDTDGDEDEVTDT